MKRFMCILLCVLLTVSFCGCNKTRCAKPVTEEYINPQVYEMMDSIAVSTAEVPSDGILTDTDSYTLYRKDGVCFVDFKDDTLNARYDTKCAGHSISFNSMEEMSRWLRFTELSDDTAKLIRHAFPLDEEKGFVMMDPEQLYTVSLPDEYVLTDVLLSANNYYNLTFESQKRLDAGRVGGGCTISLQDKGSIASLMSRYFRFQLGDASYDRCYTDTVKNATVYEYETEVWKCREVQYSLKTDTKTVYISETYILSTDTPYAENYHLSSVDIFGCENGVYFYMRPHYSDEYLLLELVKEMKIVECDF